MAGSSDEAGPSRPRQTNQKLTVRSRDHGRKRRSDGGGAEPSRRRRTEEPSPPPERDADLDVYDPDQSVLERRRIQREMREMQQNVKANPDEFLQKDPKALLEHLAKAEEVLRNVKQTGEAAIDARGLVIVADLAARRVQRLTAGNVGNGIDVDEFVSKSISYMKHGRGIEDDEAHELSSTQRHRRRPQRGAIGADDDDNGDDGDPLNWSHLGRYAVVQCIRRPAVPGFLMGPLSIEKKARKMTQRSGPFKVSNLLEVRPQELQAEDLKKNDKNDLPSICKKIYVHLENAQQESQDAVENELNDDATSDDEREIMDRHSLRSTGGIDLLRFVVNPRSFGQTVENLFYVSFLIREGSIKLTFDDNGLPALEPVRKQGTATQAASRNGAMRHQAIMSIDYATWRDLIDAFEIKTPMIPHRREEDNAGPGAKGWYS
ncbi:Nse4 C-terminal-domain-containing protein [Schizothecium vesticola]|uniref:Non-structural maintenance of chromosomes element 4 n=1 Tax=Schizothecium vesticola TaxID=314040 RepID=A0AA40K816_9PEZI|nr:Nse4 C-terminal-domain-containing protein [Schizothecium vesticola]